MLELQIKYNGLGIEYLPGEPIIENAGMLPIDPTRGDFDQMTSNDGLNLKLMSDSVHVEEIREINRTLFTNLAINDRNSIGVYRSFESRSFYPELTFFDGYEFLGDRREVLFFDNNIMTSHRRHLIIYIRKTNIEELRRELKKKYVHNGSLGWKFSALNTYNKSYVTCSIYFNIYNNGQLVLVDYTGNIPHQGSDRIIYSNVASADKYFELILKEYDTIVKANKSSKKTKKMDYSDL